MRMMRYYRRMQLIQALTIAATLAIFAASAAKGYYILMSINLACATSQVCGFLHARYRAEAIRRTAAAHGMTWKEFEAVQADPYFFRRHP